MENASVLNEGLSGTGLMFMGKRIEISSRPRPIPTLNFPLDPESEQVKIARRGNKWHCRAESLPE